MKNMKRKFRTADYEAILEKPIRIGDALDKNHLARFVVEIIKQLDLKAIYAAYGESGGSPYAPEVLLGLLLYGYATGTFSSRKIEKMCHEALAYMYIGGGFHPDHATIAEFRRRFLKQISELFVQVLLMAQIAGYLKLGNVSVDGSKIRADASKSQAVSYERLLEMQAHFEREVQELLALAEAADQTLLPPELVIEDEISFRQQRLLHLAEAKRVLEERNQQRYAAEQAEYESKMRERQQKVEQSGRKLSGREPAPPTAAVDPKAQYNFTDPESRIMKNPTDAGFDQYYNAQVAVDQAELLIVATTLSNHPNDKQELLPTVDAIDPQVGKPTAVAADNGFFSETNIKALATRQIDPFLATGRDPHHLSWLERFAQQPDTPPPVDASPKVQMAYKLKSDIGKAIYGLRKSTVEPVIGIIKEVLGFRQFSLRGLLLVTGEWTLVCLAFNLKRLHRLQTA